MDRKEILVMLVIAFLFAFTAIAQMIEAAFFHELGHMITARKYSYTKGKITLKMAIKLFDVKDCVITRDIWNKAEGDTELENNYLPYTEHQIKNIAVAGTIWAIVFIVVTGTIAELLIKILITLFLRESVFYDIAYITQIFTLLTTGMNVVFNVIKYVKGKDVLWSDRMIAENPYRFKIWIKEELR